MARLAARQHGVVSWPQLAALGFTRRMVDRRVSAGALHVLHRGVYAVGHVPRTPESRCMAAVLACGDGAAVSHRSAAALFRLCPFPAIVDVTVAKKRQSRRGIRLHWTRSLEECDLAQVRGIPVTGLRRTLVDLADVVDPNAWAAALRSAERFHDFDRRRLRSRHGRRPLPLAHELTRSELERAFLELVRRAGLPAPVLNARVGDMEVDALWVRQRVAVELDGYAYHRSRAELQRDDRKGTALALAGYTVLRFTYADVVDDPGYVVAALRAALQPVGLEEI